MQAPFRIHPHHQDEGDSVLTPATTGQSRPVQRDDDNKYDNTNSRNHQDITTLPNGGTFDTCLHNTGAFSASSDDDFVTTPTKIIDKKNARFVTPSSLEEAATIVELNCLTGEDMNGLVKSLKVLNAIRLKKDMKKQIIATRIYELKVPLAAAFEVMLHRHDSDHLLSEIGLKVYRCPTINVHVTMESGAKKLVWGNEGLSGKRSSSEPNTTMKPIPNRQSKSPRRADFETSEFARILHVLADPRMIVARQQIKMCRTRHELDSQPSDPWDEHISPLFNDESYKPPVVDRLAGGVTRSDIIGIDPAKFICERDSSFLKSKFAKLKSLYGTCVIRYEASGQSDSETFKDFAQGKSYIMYAHCFVSKYPILQTMTTRSVPTESQREEGINDDYDEDDQVCRKLEKSGPRRLSANSREIRISGLESLSALAPIQTDSTTRNTQEEELKRLKAETADAEGRAFRGTLESIEKTERMRDNAKSEAQRALYGSLLESLMGKLKDSV